MNDPRRHSPDSIVYRVMSAGLGTVLVGCAVMIFVLVPFSEWPAMIAAAALFVLGADAIIAAKRRRWSLLSRIGPLP